MTIIINIPSDLQKAVDQKVVQGGYSDSAEFILDSVYQSLKNDRDEEALETAWAEEINRRLEGIKNGTATLRSDEDVYSAVDKIFETHRNAVA